MSPHQSSRPVQRIAVARAGSASDADRGGSAERADAVARARIRIVGVVPGDHPLHGQRLIHRAGEYRNRVQRTARRHHAARGTLPSVGFSPTMLPNAAGTRPGPGGVGAQREVHDARGNRARRSGRRAARHMSRVEHVARHAVRAARADQAGGELVQIGLADQQRARVQQSLHRRRGRRRRCRQSRGTPRWSAGRRRRCCPLPRTARPRAAALRSLRLQFARRAPASRHPAGG